MRLSPRLFRASSAALILASLAACEKKTTPESAPPAPEKSSPKSVSAEPTSFDAIARHLDSGGGLYAYLSTEGFVKSASEILLQAQKAFEAQANVSPEQKAKIDAAWTTFKPFLGNSGLKEISGIGMSSLAIRPGYYRTKSIIHHYKDQGTGFIWKLNGGQARALEIISYLPESTAAAGSFDFTMEPIWAELTARAAGNAELRTALEQIQAQIKAGTGLDLSTLLGGLGPNTSYVVTLDESSPFTIPHNGTSEPLTIPEPRLAFLFQIRDEAVLKQLDERLSALPMIAAADQDNLKVRKVNVPLPFPFLSPTIAWKNDLLIVSSNEALITEMLEIKDGKKPGLGATERFKKVMADLPAPASTFGYVDPLFNKTMMAVQMQSLKSQPGMDSSVQQFIQSIWNSQITEAQAGIGQDTPEGWITVTNGGPGPSQIAAIGAVVPAALLSVAVPNFLRAKQQAEEKKDETPADARRMRSRVKCINKAVTEWAEANNKPSGEQPNSDDIRPYLCATLKSLDFPASTTTVTLVEGYPAVSIPPVGGKASAPNEIVEKFKGELPQDYWQQ